MGICLTLKLRQLNHNETTNGICTRCEQFAKLAGPVTRFFSIPETNDWTKSMSMEEITSTNHGITQIGIERGGGGLGAGPTYAFICESDGTFRYEGVGNVVRKGNLTGKIPPEDFNRLAQFISDSGYMELESAYTPRIGGVTDQPHVWTMVVANAKRKVVNNYQNAGPPKLWAIEQLIDALLARRPSGTHRRKRMRF